MSTFLIAAPNYMTDPITETSVFGGDWNVNFPVANIGAEFFTEKTISSDATAASTQFEVAFAESRDVKFFGIPEGNFSSAAKLRIMGSLTTAWSGVTLGASAAANDTSLTLTASGNKNFKVGQGFTLPSDTRIYEFTSALALGENLVTYSEDLTNAAWLYSLGGATHVVTGGKAAPDGSNNAVEVEWVSGGAGLFRQNLTLSTATLYNVSFWVRLTSITRSSGTNTLGIDLYDGTITHLTDAETPLNEWIRVSVDVTSGTIGGGIDIVGSFNVTAFTAEFWGFQVTTGSGVKDYITTTSSAITGTSSGSINVRLVGTASTGIAGSHSSGALVTCKSGEYLENNVLDTGLIDYYDVLYPVGARSWGSSGVWDGIGTPEDRASLNINNQFTLLLSGFAVCQYLQVRFFDESNADGYISFDDFYACSVYEPSHHMSIGSSLGLKTNSTRVESEGGASAFKRNKAQRVATVRSQFVTVQEAFTNQYDLQRELDITEDFYFIFDSSDTTLRHRRSFPARFDNLSNFTYQHANYISTEFNIVERIV